MKLKIKILILKKNTGYICIIVYIYRKYKSTVLIQFQFFHFASKKGCTSKLSKGFAKQETNSKRPRMILVGGSTEGADTAVDGSEIHQLIW